MHALISRTESTEWLALFATLLAVVGALYGGYRWLSPRLRRVTSAWSALVELLFGRDAEPANPITGAPAVPEVPGIGVQLARHIEQETKALDKVSGDVARLTDAVAKIADQSTLIADHERRLVTLEEQVLERVVGKVETVEMLRTIQAVSGQADTTEIGD